MKTLRPKKYCALLWICAALAIPTAQGATVVAVSGPNETASFSILSNNLMVGFSTATSYTNVAIEVFLSSFTSGDWNLEAYLTDQVGAGTTAAANEIANDSSLISIPAGSQFPPYTVTPYTVFSGLMLPAGAHYLVLSGTRLTPNDNVFWVSSSDFDRSVVTDVGASVTRPFAFDGGDEDPYLPASIFGDVAGLGLWFTVTSNPVAAIPEPSTVALSFGALLMVAFAKRRRSLQQPV